jgi:hypothetical protein
MSEEVLPAGQEQMVASSAAVTEPSAPNGSPWLRPPKLLWLIGAAIVVVAAIVVALVLTLGGGKKDLTVTFTLMDIGGTSTCDGGTGGYSDIGPGTDVVVRDGSNNVLGVAALGDGQHRATPDSGIGGGCIWQTTVHNVPTGKSFYTVEVGHRGEQTYSPSQLDKSGWLVDLTLGGS